MISNQKKHLPIRLITDPVTVERVALTLGDLDRALGVLAAGAVVGEHVEHDEIGESPPPPSRRQSRARPQ